MPDKLQLDLPALLPEAPDEGDECVRRLIAGLEAQEGVERLHVVETTVGETGRLCVHYDPDVSSWQEVRRSAESAGTRLTGRYGHLSREIGAGHVGREAVERLKWMRGVTDVTVASGLLRLEFDRERTDEAQLLGALEEVGVRGAQSEPDGHAEPRDETTPRSLEEGGEQRHHQEGHDQEGHDQEGHDQEGHDHDHGGIFGEKTELIFAISSGVTLIIGFLISVLTDVTQWVPLGFYFAAYFFGGFYTLREAVEKVANRQFEIDFLMLVAATGAAILGEWAEGALLLFLFSLGHSLEGYAMGRARRAIEALGELAPQTAVVRRDGGQREIAVEELVVGDTVIVKPNERLPADGFVTSGESSVDQSAVTGESVPVDKRPVEDPDSAADSGGIDPESQAFAGTINGAGALEVRVTKRAEDNTLSRVVKLVSEAESQKSPTQRFTDKFQRYFVPAVLALVAVLLASPLVTGEAFADSFYRAMAVLVAASPCALAIATPSAVLSAVARAGRGGVLVKGGGPLENLGTLTAVAFDKTGTLTEGKPRLTDVEPHGDAEETELLRAAVAVERLSDHPLAAAVVSGGTERGAGEDTPEATSLESITGRGVRAELDGETVYVGKDALFGEVGGPELPEELRQAVERLEGEGRTTMIVRAGERYLGVLGLMDTPRESASEVVERLREIGLRRMIMISGDNQRVADAVAGQIGLDEAWGDLLPEDKVEAIKRLNEREQRVAMVGDGVNDAPAMANSTVGIAMGAAGSDVALETADVALMSDDLTQLPFAGGLSRRTSRLIRQNLFISLGVVALLVPATILGLGIGPAVAVHEGSTLVVVFNALRLLGHKA
ncbi:heavy metal translocating P-type ATPase [Rubrobacter aplysinae]|uniref:heavy metal translocating P-type ATPase n=1 Tax=Rubrobacter aplysinae TaxID=909625 RepID=UPI00064BFAD8|nr:heavy metal translocating P-type ATPase [Rubrobacter aplysinae]